ncbi:MAG: ABC-2 family transporter protein [Thermomicrobiales bacterium]|nr:ABC-2 family transporter protein [Thermomicrobiales bacterium]
MTPASQLRVLRRLTSIELVGSLMYRTQFAVYMVSTVVSIMVGLFIWLRVGESGGDLPVDREFIVTYYLMLAVVRTLVSTWHSEFLAQVIRKGELNAWLARPGSYILNLLANNFSEKIVKMSTILPMLGVIWWFYRDQFALPTEISRWLLFIPALVGAFVLEFCLTTTIGSLGFWMDENSGIARSRHVIAMALSGELVPLALYPAWATTFLDIQVFRFTMSFPLEVLLTDLSSQQLVAGFVLQFAWLVAIVMVCRFTWQRGLHAYSGIGA